MAKIENPLTVVQQGGADPDLAVFDYSKVGYAGNRLYTPDDYWFANGCTQKKIEVILHDNYSGENPCFCNATSALEEVIVRTNGTITSMSNGTIVYKSYVKHITLDFDTSSATVWSTYIFRYAGDDSVAANKGCVIDGRPIDFSGVTADYNFCGGESFFYQAYIKSIRFAPNTLNNSGACRFYQSGDFAMDDDSLVSLCNVLGETTTGTFTVGDTGYADRQRLATLTGRVDTSAGYSLFVKDDSASLTLAEFVTNVKGWTLGS